MDDSRNQPELETLSCKPICSRCQQENCQCRPVLLKPLKRGFLGLNAHVIKPETRANKGEVAEESPEQPKEYAPFFIERHDCLCEYCRDIQELKLFMLNNNTEAQTEVACKCFKCLKTIEQPNQNIMIIEEIEGLLSQANEKMYDLPIHPMRSKAIEEIDLLRKVTIKTELRKAFE